MKTRFLFPPVISARIPSSTNTFTAEFTFGILIPVISESNAIEDIGREYISLIIAPIAFSSMPVPQHLHTYAVLDAFSSNLFEF